MNVFEKVKRKVSDGIKLISEAVMGVKETAENNDKLNKWKDRLELAKDKYAGTRNAMQTYSDYYYGDRAVRRDPNSNREVTKVATNVRNIVYELIESEVDSSIPMPRVRAIHREDEELAKKIEHMLENKIKRCGLVKLNDLMERNTYVQGADFFHVQWDVNAGLHSEVGDLKITEVHPRKMVPQPGIVDIEDMDYFFIQEAYTKKRVKQLYGVDVSEAENDDTTLVQVIDDATSNNDLVVVNTAYFRNKEGGVGIFIWCDDIIILDMEEYEARYLDRCAKCGAVMVNGVCPECGGKKSKKAPQDYEELIDSIEIRTDFRDQNGKPVMQNSDDITEDTPFPMMDEMGQPMLDEAGQPRVEIKKTKKKVPYYKPNIYPLVERKNISVNNQLHGESDVRIIMDQQDTVKKLGSKINEKLLKGGSYVTLPQGKKVETNDKELKIIRVANPQEKALIDVINVQPNVMYDQQLLEVNYNWAKSTIGVTDAFQGKFQASETSGAARQYAINQAAGRLESKRTMKNEAFAKLYEYMFKFWLAFADQTMEITSTNPSGEQEFDEIDRHEFLRLDKAGEFYWDDEFIFETDPTSTLMQNREALWNQTDMKMQSGAFGPVGDLETSRAYWTIMKANGYPNAGMILSLIEDRIGQQEQQMMQMQAAQAMPEQMPEEGAMPGEMPVM